MEQAEEGTLFLDEVEALSAKGQVVLLRFLQDMVYKPLGSKTSKRANLRIIAASNQSLAHLVDAGLFRQDLYFRLNVLMLPLPPLRERFEDISLLAEYFLDRYRQEYNQPEKRFQQNSLLWMERYSWPGNVRELENVIHRGFVLSPGEVIDISQILLQRQGLDRRQNIIDRRTYLDINGGLTEVKQRIIEHIENIYLRNLLTQTHGNITKAAKLAGKERRALGKLLKKYMIDRRNYCDG